MNTLEFIYKLKDIEEKLWNNLDLISSNYYPETVIYDFVHITLSSESVHWVFITNEGQHIADAKPILEVFKLVKLGVTGIKEGGYLDESS